MELPNRFKMGQREGWDSVAEGWKEWWEPIEKGVQKLSQRLIELAEIKSGQRVLDVATGIGEPSMTAAKVIVTGGHVLATDVSRQMLTIAKEELHSCDCKNIIEFKESDAELLDLANSSFDAFLRPLLSMTLNVKMRRRKQEVVECCLFFFI